MTAEKKLVSIVIPCYNQAHFLKAAIESALAQTYPDIEVIVVDDGSADETSAVASAYSSVKLIRQENSGLSAARNAGIGEAGGDYVLLLDSDDVLLPPCVETRLRHAAPGIGVVTGNFRKIDSEGASIEMADEGRRLPPPPHFYMVVARNWGPPSGWLIDRRVFSTCGLFDPLLASCEDWDFLIRAALRFDIAYDREVGMLYRQQPSSMTRNHLRMLDSGARVMRKNAAIAPGRWPYLVASQRGMFQHAVGAVLSSIFRDYRRGEAFRRYWKLAARRPMVLVYTVVWVFRAIFNRVRGVKGQLGVGRRTL